MNFDYWFESEFNDLHEAICCGDLVAKNYKKAMFKAWQASASREGYKLVPIEPTEEMYLSGVKERSSGGNTVDVYKAMINSI